MTTNTTTVKFANVTVIRDRKNLDTTIESISRRGKKLDKEIHAAGVSCLYHAREHGDTRQLVALIMALPASSRRKGFIAWAEAHAPVEIESTKQSVDITLAKGRKPEDFDLEGAAENPFWAFTKEATPVKPTVELAIERFRKALANCVKKETLPGEYSRVLNEAIDMAMEQINADVAERTQEYLEEQAKVA